MAVRKRSIVALAVITPLVLAAQGCKSKDTKNGVSEVARVPAKGEDAAVVDVADAATLVLPAAPPLARTPLGLPASPSPDYNPTTAEKVALGALLFRETALSSSGEMSCASCHEPSHNFSSDAPFNKTAAGTHNQRHTPTLSNVAYHQEFYWDGRTKPLEAHIIGHWQGQLGLSPAEATASLALKPTYRAHFQRAFRSDGDKDRAAEALASYVRTLLGGNSAWDRYEAGDASAVSAMAIAGAAIFNQRAGCATCHAPPLYTDLEYHNLGLPQSDAPDVGREGHTQVLTDRGSFKTPSLRGVSQSAPYFHNGSASTLLQVLEHKESQGSPRLSTKERSQLLAFLDALTSE
ncbi:MAG: cytochrome-c peroxidase [Myxococcales bacterium]|nr:cytochrome-c peroxidase [Myxococcales bacterium]